jgi:hypothetical protein
MATYNLAAADLLTLLGSTLSPQTEQAVLESLSSAFGSSFLSGISNIVTAAGPSDTSTSGNGYSSTTLPAGTQLFVVTTPNSTDITGSSYDSTTAGNQSTGTYMNVVSPGGVAMLAGDQSVTVADQNTGGVPDTLLGGAGREKLVSALGSNVLIGGSGLNTLVGGAGADRLIGGAHSRLVAGSGPNLLMSSTVPGGHDTLVGGTGADLLIAQGGNNRLVAGTGFNTLLGGPGNDTIIGGGHTDISLGSGNSRVVESVAGAMDTVTAGSGHDTVVLAYGTANLAVSVVGSTGSLRMADLAGSNTITGGAGSDTVVLSSLVSGVSQTNTSNQTITAGSASGGIRIVTNEAYSNYSIATAPGGGNTVTFSDTGQTLTINDASGLNVTLVFGSGHTPVKV